jgi:hypothetical protein
MLFQFHSGSIQADYVVCKRRLDNGVSIPLWFDSGRLTRNSLQRFRTRFNSTLVRFKLKSRIREIGAITTVSIPLWFDSSPLTAEFVAEVRRSFNSTLVRFKPLLNHNFTTNNGLVSIPLWFDSSRISDIFTEVNSKCFNSTLVRFKPASLTHLLRQKSLFQFHSGSIQAGKMKKEFERMELVSIPLWFDSSFECC